VFDGTNLGIGTATPQTPLHVYGTNGITIGVANTSWQTAAIRAIDDGGTYKGALAFYTHPSAGSAGAPTERARIDSSGNLGVGVTPSAWSGIKAVELTNSVALASYTGGANAIGFLTNNAYFNGTNWIYKLTGSNASLQVMPYTGGFQWQTAPSGTAGNAISFTQAMTLTAGGNLLVGATSQVGVGKLCVEAITAISVKGILATNCGDIEFIRSDNNARAFIFAANANDFYIANGTFSNYAALNGQSFTGWTFGSDRRIKKNIVDLSYGLNSILALQPREFDYINNDQHDIGFIAQELKEVIPEAVSGEEIPYAAEDTQQERAKKTMGITKDVLIPVLVKAIQELNARIETLESA
jgi:hypothetical protein